MRPIAECHRIHPCKRERPLHGRVCDPRIRPLGRCSFWGVLLGIPHVKGAWAGFEGKDWRRLLALPILLAQLFGRRDVPLWDVFVASSRCYC